jgi:hypothetical protein
MSDMVEITLTYGSTMTVPREVRDKAWAFENKMFGNPPGREYTDLHQFDSQLVQQVLHEHRAVAAAQQSSTSSPKGEEMYYSRATHSLQPLHGGAERSNASTATDRAIYDWLYKGQQSEDIAESDKLRIACGSTLGTGQLVEWTDRDAGTLYGRIIAVDSSAKQYTIQQLRPGDSGTEYETLARKYYVGFTAGLKALAELPSATSVALEWTKALLDPDRRKRVRRDSDSE